MNLTIYIYKLPPSDWFEAPLGRQAAVGDELLEVAQQNVTAPSINISPLKAEGCCSFITTTDQDQSPRSHHK